MTPPGDHPVIRTITMLAPLADGAAAEASRRLQRLDRGPSPFSASDRTHFARLLVLPSRLDPQPRPAEMRWDARLVDLITHLGRPQRQDSFFCPYLMFSASYDDPTGDVYGADHGSYVEHLRGRLGILADTIWDTCEHYPGRRQQARFGAFFAERTLPARYVFAPAQGATVSQVTSALRRRRQVIDVAVTTQRAPDAVLRERFDEAVDGCGPAATVAAAAAAVDLDEAREWNGGARQDAIAYPGLRRASRRRQPPDLADVQGLTVGYPTHDAAAFMFLRITDPAGARAWLARMPVTTAAQAREIVESAPRDAPVDADPAAQVARHIALSHTGLARLGVPDAALAGFDRAFRAGMAHREHALAPGLGTGPWQQRYLPAAGGVDVLVHVSAPDQARLEPAFQRLREAVERSAAVVEVGSEQGHRIVDPTVGRDGRPRYLEHFGFADGISQPVVQGLGRPAPASLPTGELLLGYADIDGDTSGATVPTRFALNGCYLVFRKLEQDVPAFRALTRDDEAAAKLVGRRRDGVALTASMAPEAGFRFQAEDADGVHCPVGAHVRRVNPRDSRPLTVDPTDSAGTDPVEPRLARRHRMVRRGIPYGEPWAAGAAGATGAATDEPQGERGLLFVALVADIGRQFEFVQTQWMNDGQAFRLGCDPDVFAGVCGPGAKVTVQGHPPSFVEIPRPLVTCRGGEYFLLPGLTALRSLS